MKIHTSCLQKLDGCFFLSMASEVTVQELVIGFWTVTSNHKLNKYWGSADHPHLMKNIMWDGFY